MTTRRVHTAFLALSVALCLTAPAGAQNSLNGREESQASPQQFRVTEPMRSMAFSRIDTQVGETVLIGKYCNQVPVYGRNAFGGARVNEYSEAFHTEARLAGYRIPGGSSSLFSDASNGSADLMVGAIVQSIQVSGCPIDGLHIFTRPGAQGVVAIEWQIFDPLEKKILFKATTYGSADVRGPPDFVTPQVLRAAFQNAAKVVLSDPNLVAAVRDPNGQMPSAQNSLFPEATAAVPAPSPRIPKLKLATAPFQNQVEALRSQVVTVISSSGSGSAFYIADGLLLTNQHVVGGAQRVKVRFFGGREIPGEVVATNAKRDVAVLRTEGAALPGLPLRLDKPALTSRVFVIGSPLGQENEGSITSGIVSAFRNEQEGPFIQSDVAITNGNSGGPMFDENGNVIGISVLVKLNQSDGSRTAINMFIPIEDALKKLNIEFESNASAPAPALSGQKR